MYSILTSNVIGAPQLILLVLVPIAIFFLGYYMGKKAGYNKGTKESESQKHQH